MGVALELVNFDQLFHTSRNQPIIINELPDDSEEDKERVNRLIYTRYTTDDLLSNLPQCECGQTTGEYNIGVVCHNCQQPVTSALETDLEPIVWMKAPKDVRALINPVVWCMLNEKFRRSNFEIMRWICDSQYKSPYGMPAVMEAVQALGIPRSYNYFVDNFDAIIDALFELKVFKQRRGIDPLQQLIREQKHCIFSQYLPLPNRSLLVIEESNVGIYVDPIVNGAVDAIRKMVSIDSELSPMKLYVKENRTIRAIHQLMEFYDGVNRTTLAKKEGIFRKHVYGTRSHFSFRAVISSLTEAHRYDELHIPWGIGTSVFRIHLVNKLFRRGMTTNEAVAFLNEHAQKYHPLLDELFQELIGECSHGDLGGIPVVFQRNPSLERGSAQAMYVTKVKADPAIPTVSLSILSVVGFNADFDGDQLNGTLSLDRKTHEALRKLAPHMSTFDLNEPRAVSKNLSMPKPVVATIANWMHDPAGTQPEPEKLQRMQQIPDAP